MLEELLTEKLFLLVAGAVIGAASTGIVAIWRSWYEAKLRRAQFEATKLEEVGLACERLYVDAAASYTQFTLALVGETLDMGKPDGSWTHESLSANSRFFVLSSLYAPELDREMQEVRRWSVDKWREAFKNLGRFDQAAAENTKALRVAVDAYIQALGRLVRKKTGSRR